MSTKKDVRKTNDSSVPKKKVATSSKVSTKKREGSVDRVANAKTEVALKKIKEKKVEATDKDKIKTKPIVSSRDVKVKSTPRTSQSNNKPLLAKKTIPATPPSSRVSKTQFYPSKNLYSNALKTSEETRKLMREDREKKKAKIQTKNDNTIEEDIRASPDSSSMSERPRTATLRKGSIVNANIVGPDAPKLKRIKDLKPAIPPPEEDKYEDDFESYESDFEAYSSSSSTGNLDISGDSESSTDTNTDNQPRELKSSGKRVSSASTDDERKLDSGNFEMPDYKHKQLLTNIKESIEKENADYRANPASLSDEGFEEAKSLQFINFLGAQEKYKRRKSAQIRRKRGLEILSMIKLDTCDYTLFNLEPVPYEKFIKTYGQSNTLQTSIQTGDDDVSEEIQTETINMVNKWTQYPIVFSKRDESDPNFWREYKSEFIGVGCDNASDVPEKLKEVDESKLNRFILSAGGLICRIEEKDQGNTTNVIHKNAKEIPFSEGYIQLNSNQDNLRDCSIKSAAFATDDSNSLLTVHPKTIDDDVKSVLALWNITQSQDPCLFLMSFSEISCCTFEYRNSDLIFAGTTNGGILMWDLKQSTIQNNIIQCPTYTTDIDVGHHSKVIAIESITDTLESVLNFAVNERQVCSLDEDGEIILWNIVTKQNSLNLIKNFTISLRNLYPNLTDLKCTDFIVDRKTINNMYISTNYGQIIKQKLNTSKVHSKTYVPETPSEAHCLEKCPFSPDYFLAGYNSGCINLYSEQVDRPLIILTNNESAIHNAEIQMVQWSKNKPFVIYSKDVSNSIHIWDLTQSDIFPICSIPFEKPISCMKLSNAKTDKSYMLLGTTDGSIYLHVLNTEHGVQTTENYQKNVNTFVKYVNRL